MTNVTDRIKKALLETSEADQRRNSMRGDCLTKTVKDDFVYVYRAVLKSAGREVHPMDFCTRSKRFAEEHAQHLAAVKGEDAVVLFKTVQTRLMYEAPNPGELFYDGPSIKFVVSKVFSAD